ncbi:MAG: efflux RND transporter permease subunit, partial [Planctomycetota bacterium]
MRAIAWFVSNGVAANLLMLMILFGGALTLLGIKEEIFPETAADRITITVPYPGAAPEEVEEGICVRIEERIQDLEGIKELTSMAAENGGTVSVEVLSGTDARRLLDDIKTRVDAIDTFPEEAEEPVIQEVMIRRQVVNVTVAGGAGERSLRALAERTREEIVALPGITHAELSSARDFEIAIEVSEEALRRHRLSFDEVAARIRRGSLDLPGGSLKTDGGEILLRSKGQAYRRREFEDLVLRARPDGTRVLLGDVAEVIDGFADTDQSARFDGEEAIQIKVFRVGDQSALEIGRRIRAYVREARARLPEGIEIGTWQDFSIYLQDRLDLLKRNAFFGLALVIGVLALFLRLRLALWISVGIVVSFLGTLWLMPILGVSMNMISAFAFIVVLGIVVDDAIVVGENIYRRQQQGETGEAGAISGVKEVAVPVVFAVLTTVTAFSPLLFVPGTTGRIWRVIPMIVIPTLLFSLVESMLILPAHLRHQRRRRELSDMRGPRHFFRAVQTRFTRGLAFFTESIYQRLLGHCLRLRYLTVATFLAIFILTVGFALGGFVRFAFMPDVEADFVVALLTMPEGTPVEVTREAVGRLEEGARAMREEIEREAEDGEGGVVRHLLTSIGEQPFRVDQDLNAGRAGTSYNGAHLAEVTVELVPSEERAVSSGDIARRWREFAGPIPGAV